MKGEFLPHWLMAGAILGLAIGVPMTGAPRLQIPALALLGTGAAMAAAATAIWWWRQRRRR